MFKIVWVFIISSFLECLWQLQKVVRHIPRVYIPRRPPHPAESSTTSYRLFQGPQNHWMGIISHTTTCPAIPTHLICQFACIQATFHSMKAHNRRIKSRSGDGLRHLGMWWTIVLHISWSTVIRERIAYACRSRCTRGCKHRALLWFREYPSSDLNTIYRNIDYRSECSSMIYDKTNVSQSSHESRSVASDGLTKCIQAMVSLNIYKKQRK